MKRAFDVVAAAIGIVVTSPLVLGAAIAVKLDSPGPAFYRSRRVGLRGRTFHMYKLRSMRVGADAQGPAVTVDSDPRVTRVGRVLRTLKIDELPQLVNVLKGDMSLVGPRPEAPEYVELYTPEQRRVLDVRPGITGEAVTVYVDEARLLTGADAEATYRDHVMQEKLALDLDYVAKRSFGRDLRILARTAALVFRRGASAPRPSPPR